MLLAGGLTSGASGSCRLASGVSTPLAEANLLLALSSCGSFKRARGEKKLIKGIGFIELSGEKKGMERLLPFLKTFPFLTTDDQDGSGVEQHGPFGSS